MSVVGKMVNRSLSPLPETDGQLLHLMLDVLDPKPDGLHHAEPSAVEELGNHLGCSTHARDHRGDCFACHDHRDVDLLVVAHGLEPALQSTVEGALVEEHQGIYGLVSG